MNLANSTFLIDFLLTDKGNSLSMEVYLPNKKDGLNELEKNLTETAGMLLKIIVSKTQPVGIYQNILSFTAMPGI